MTPFQRPSIFVSATSRGLKSLRVATADHLKARKFDAVVQEEFDCDYQQIKDTIRDKIAPCDAVVLLVGPAYGFEATDWPAGVPKCSYTQLEYELAVELKKPVYRYIASAKYPHTPYDPEPAEHLQRQQAHIQRLKAQDHVWYEFDSPEQLLTLLEKTRFHKLVKPNLPFDSIGTLFKGRDDALKLVRQSLLTRPAHATAVTSKQAIHGLGGVGKTRFAIEYAHRFASEYSARLYANADTPSALDANMAELCHVLDLPERHEKEQPKQLEAVQRWLRMHAGWLLVLDNVDTPEAQAAMNAAFKNLTSGHVLITSRLTDWGTGVNAIELDTLSIPASTEFLLERTAGQSDAPTSPRRQPSQSDPTDAAALATDLGGLALALEQAGAYICANRITFVTYRTRLTEIEREVLKWFDADVMKYPKSVAVTWQASVNQLYPDGRALLNLLCWLAPDPIPVALIRTEPKEPPHVPITNRERALKDLADYSLAKWNADGSAVSVHRLVQDVTRTRLTEPTRTETLKDSLWVMDAFVVGDPGDVHLWRDIFAPLQGHIMATSSAATAMGVQWVCGHLMNDFGCYFLLCADFPRSEQLLRGALAIAEPLLGAEHHGVAARMNNLARLLRDTGRHIEAEPLCRGALAIWEGADGQHNPNVAGGLISLANLLRLTGRHAEAEPLYRRALDICRTVYGLHRPEVARAQNNLGEWLRDAGRYTEAQELFTEALAVSLATLGPDHPVIGTRLNNLALVLKARGHLSEAEPLLHRALASAEAIYGTRHPVYVSGLINIADLFGKTGREQEAESLYRVALTIYETIFGTDHPDVALVLNNLAGLLKDAHRYDEAEPLFHRALEILEATYGPNHAQVASCLNNLAGLCTVHGRDADAESLYRRALAITELVYGPDHTAVAIRLSNIALLLGRTGRPGETEPLYRRALDIFSRHLGHEHPHTQVIRKRYHSQVARPPHEVASADGPPPVSKRAE